MKDNKEFIKGIYDKYDEYLKDENNTKFTQVKNIKDNDFGQKKKSWKLDLVKAVSAIAACGVIAMSFLISNNSMQEQTPKNQTIVGKTTTKDGITLSKVENFETFYKIVKDNYKESSERIYTMNDANGLDDTLVKSSTLSPSDLAGESTSTSKATTEQSTNTATRNNDYSKTNIQVENVDEADIVKTDGNYIFYVVSNEIVIVDIKNRDKMIKVAQIDYKQNDFKPSELYISGNNLIVIGKENSYSRGITVRETAGAIYKKGIYKQKTVSIVYDLSDITNPKETRRVEIEGNYVSSRMIDNNIYFVANKSIPAYDIVKSNREDLDEEIYKPTYKDTISSSVDKIINFDQIYYFNNIETLNYLTLGGFSLNGTQEADVKTFMGAGENIYCSTKNMYIVKSKNVYDAQTYMNYGKDTKILKFGISNGKIDFKAEADIEGGINNQFSMDENNGYFRIATTIGKTYSMDNSTSNSLYILDENMKEVGRLDGIAKAEKIYSVRYVGNKAYIVTFKEIDPLFVIDLSDVRNPKILGELKIPGYSTYLHPYDETHLIGFGYNTIQNSIGTGTMNDGLKMAMFDVSDVNNPKELFNVKVGDSRTSSKLTSNHKALLFSKEKNFIAFPVSSYSNGRTNYKAQVYDIDLNKGFTLRGEIEHKDETVTTQKYYYGNYKLSIDRIIYSNDVFYTMSNKLIKASDMNTLKEVSALDIERK